MENKQWPRPSVSPWGDRPSDACITASGQRSRGKEREALSAPGWVVREGFQEEVRPKLRNVNL